MYEHLVEAWYWAAGLPLFAQVALGVAVPVVAFYVLIICLASIAVVWELVTGG